MDNDFLTVQSLLWGTRSFTVFKAQANFKIRVTTDTPNTRLWLSTLAVFCFPAVQP
jgi:hypothetical protein